jgi:hypothetical protein
VRALVPDGADPGRDFRQERMARVLAKQCAFWLAWHGRRVGFNGPAQPNALEQMTRAIQRSASRERIRPSSLARAAVFGWAGGAQARKAFASYMANRK